MNTAQCQSPTRIAFPHCIYRKPLLLGISFFLLHYAILLLFPPRALSDQAMPHKPRLAIEGGAHWGYRLRAQEEGRRPALPLCVGGGGLIRSGIPLTHGSTQEEGRGGAIVHRSRAVLGIPPIHGGTTPKTKWRWLRRRGEFLGAAVVVLWRCNEERVIFLCYLSPPLQKMG
jgi:hypothetical protein